MKLSSQKKCYKYCAAAISILLLTAMLVTSGSRVHLAYATEKAAILQEEVVQDETKTNDIKLPDNFEIAADNNRLVLYANYETAEIIVQDKENNARWYSNPPDREQDSLAKGIKKMNLNAQLFVNYSPDGSQIKLVNNYSGSISAKSFKHKKIKDGVEFVFDFNRKSEMFKVPVSYILGPDSFTAAINLTGIEEYGESKIISMSLLPNFGAGSEAETGYILVPDGSGALIYFNNEKQMQKQYEAAIYGRDASLSKTFESSVRQDVRLPVFGVKKGNQGFLAVVENGAPLGTITANVSKYNDIYNKVYCDFSYRIKDTVTLAEQDWSAREITIISDDHVKTDSCSITYFFLDSGAADYSGMASRYRKYLKEHGILTKKQETKKVPFYIEFLGGVKRQKSVLGLPMKVLEPMTSYMEFSQTVINLVDAGVENPIAAYKGWQKDGYESAIPLKAELESKLGGKKAFKRMLGDMKDRNVEVFLHADIVNIFKGGSGISRFRDIVKNVNRAPSLQFIYKYSTLERERSVRPWNLMSPESMENVAERVEKALSGYDTGIMSDTLGSVLYTDFRNKSIIDREESMKIQCTALEKLGEKLILHSPNAYSLKYASHIINLPSGSSEFDVTNETIPFYQMVLHGYIDYSIEAYNLSQDKPHFFLKMIETGSYPYYVWTANSSSVLSDTKYSWLYSTGISDWFDKAVAQYHEVKAVLGEISGRTMVSHRKLAREVFESTYDNGVRIYVNYSESDYKIENITVKAASYELVKGGQESK